jgi:hypothetical protein
LAPIGFAAAGFAAPALDSVARDADFAGPRGFNGFDGAVCDGPEDIVFPGFSVALRSDFLADFLADAARVFEDGFFAAVFDGMRVAFAAGSLGDFFCVFLDIRLPFVAFGRSIMGYCGSCPTEPWLKSVAGQG